MKYPLETERLLLRPFEMRDLDDMYAYHSLPEVARYVYWEPKSRAETELALKRRLADETLARQGDVLVLAVIPRERNVIAGEVMLFHRSETHKQGEIGFVFNPAYHGKGYATEAARKMLDLGFGVFDFHRIFGRCDARNTSSAKLMERLGMRREAHFVENEFFKGAWGDEFVYAILQREWGHLS